MRGHVSSMNSRGSAVEPIHIQPRILHLSVVWAHLYTLFSMFLCVFSLVNIFIARIELPLTYKGRGGDQVTGLLRSVM